MEGSSQVNLNDAVIVITGGGGCLGREISKHLIAEGAITVILDLMNQVPPDGLAEYSHYQSADLSNHVEASEAFERIAEKFSRIDGLVNCVGMIHSEAFAGFSSGGLRMHDPNMFRKVIDCNLMTTFNATSACVREMISRRLRGAIVNLSSVSSAGNPGQAAYSSAKAAIDSLTISLARELGPYGIRVNAVLPGLIDTQTTREAMSQESLEHLSRLTPLRKLGHAGSVAHMISACLENDFLSGALIPISGGFKF